MAASESQVQPAQLLTDLSEYQFAGDSATVERKCGFITAYREHGSIYHSALASGINRKTVYRWMESDPQFAEAVTDSKEDSIEELEQSVYRRAFKSDLLAMFYLKAHKPKFRDKVMIDVSEVQERINQMLERVSVAQLQQLPAAMTDFIDTGYSEQSGEYQTVPRETSEPLLQFPPEPQQAQKED